MEVCDRCWVGSVSDMKVCDRCWVASVSDMEVLFGWVTMVNIVTGV